MIQVNSFVFNPFMENTYIVYDDTKEAIIVDPGCYEQEEREVLTNFVDNHDLKVVRILNTHCHIDHVLGNRFVAEYYNLLPEMSSLEERQLRAVKLYAPNYGFHHYEEVEDVKIIAPGDQITFGDSRLDILFVPGHSPGHLAFVANEEKFCLGGDVLFKGSVGRTDLPGGDMDVLMESIRTKLYALPSEFMVYPGHGDPTTVKEEMASNPFCRG